MGFSVAKTRGGAHWDRYPGLRSVYCAAAENSNVLSCRTRLASAGSGGGDSDPLLPERFTNSLGSPRTFVGSLPCGAFSGAPPSVRRVRRGVCNADTSCSRCSDMAKRCRWPTLRRLTRAFVEACNARARDSVSIWIIFSAASIVILSFDIFTCGCISKGRSLNGQVVRRPFND